MNPHDPDDADRDPLSAYLDGDPDAVRAAGPREPGEAEWEAARLRIHAKLDAAREHTLRFRRGALWLAAGAALAASAAALAWVAFHVPAPKNDPKAPDVVEVKPAPQPGAPVAPPPHESKPDPLAEYAVLPMATNDEVVLHRVPGDGMLPVGNPPLPGALSLASEEDVELDEPNPAWPRVTFSPGAVPMIFAAKPR
jgi:hypothetical protein